MSAYQEHQQGKPPSPPVFHLPERGKVQSMINRWVRSGYALTNQPYKRDPIWLALTKKGMDELGLPYTPGLPPKAELKESGHLYCNDTPLQLAERFQAEKTIPDIWDGFSG